MAALNSTLREHLAASDSFYDDQARAERWIFTFRVERDKWADSLLPARGADTPDELGGTSAGEVLRRQIDYRSDPGFVIATLTCGEMFGIIPAHEAVATLRNVGVEREIINAWDNTEGEWVLVNGPIDPAEGKAQRHFYRIKQANRRRLTRYYQILRIYAYLSEAADFATVIEPFDDKAGCVNTNIFTALGTNYAAYRLLFQGVEIDGRSGMKGWYNCVFPFVVSPFMGTKATLWPRTVNRVKYEQISIRVPTVHTDDTEGRERSIPGKRDVALSEGEGGPFYIRGTWDFSAIEALL